MAVYTHLNHNEIAEFLAQYDLGELQSFKGITEGVSNTNYLITVIPNEGEGSRLKGDPSHKARDDTQKYILTLFERHFKIEDLPYFVALMEWWSARGIDCPKPLRTKDGRALVALKEKPAIVVSFLEGDGARKITPEHLAQLGKLAANMHIAGMEFPHTRANGLSVAGWEKLVDQVLPRADVIEPGLSELIREEYNYLSEHWPEGLPSGPIHADLFPDNVFFTKLPVRLSGVIDFYFACNDMWAYDVAICINAWCFDERMRLVPERVQALMASYNDTRTMTQEEELAFPLLLRGAALRFLLTRTFDWLNPAEGADITPKDPREYSAKLRYFQNT